MPAFRPLILPYFYHFGEVGHGFKEKVGQETIPLFGKSRTLTHESEDSFFNILIMVFTKHDILRPHGRDIALGICRWRRSGKNNSLSTGNMCDTMSQWLYLE